jgi:hypothetical protein
VLQERLVSALINSGRMLESDIGRTVWKSTFQYGKYLPQRAITDHNWEISQREGTVQ